ncbi:MAG TPA: hypothetical protein VGP41_04165, partial [Candidatus Lustribacter sp.]|nr:hypothetical protein [Candidatus Lustribacter sp.]
HLGESRGYLEQAHSMRRVVLVLVAFVALAGCREVRVNQVRTGTTVAAGGTQVIVLRDKRTLEGLGISAEVNFRKEFAVILLMGPHRESGYVQIIESIRANADRVRIVAFERAPIDGGEPAAAYRTYTMWFVPNIAYRPGSHVDVVTPSGDPITATTVR